MMYRDCHGEDTVYCVHQSRQSIQALVESDIDLQARKQQKLLLAEQSRAIERSIL